MNKNKMIKCSVATLLCIVVLFQLTMTSVGKACIIPEASLDVNVDVGSIHFRGETAEFYILTSLSGNPVNPQTITADLYFNGSYFADLTSAVQWVSKGLCRVTYTIPNDALAGTYALEVNTCYYGVQGTALKCFVISQTLTNWNAWLIDATETAATIKTDIGIIQVSLDNLNAKVISIDERAINIQTDLGVIKTNLNAINASIISIDDSLVVVKTNLGLIELNLSLIDGQIVSFNDTTVTVQTDLGQIKANIDTILEKVTKIDDSTVEIKTKLGTITGTITEIQDDIATIKTDIGDIKMSLLSIKNTSEEATANPVSVWWILVIVVAIVMVTVLAIAVKNRRK